MTKRRASLTVAALGLAGFLVMAVAVGGCAKDGTPPAPSANQADQEKTVKVNNLRCPIMPQEPLPTDRVPVSLTRDYVYKGQSMKVGFCCSACPLAWDKLTDAQRDAKLAAPGVLKPVVTP